MMTGSVFVDTSGWMAYLVASKIHHELAEQEMRQAIGDPQVAIFTTDHVIAELVALMTARRAPRQQVLESVAICSSRRASASSIPIKRFSLAPGIC